MTNTITLRATTLYRDGEARASISHDWIVNPNGSSAAPACAPNRCVFVRGTPEVAFLRDGREFCKDCMALRDKPAESAAP